MRRAILLTLSLVFISCGASLDAADDLVLGRLGEYLESLRAQANIPGMSAVLVGPTDIQWERGFGQQNIERAITTRPDTPFHVNGLTQLFTATTILRCAEDGKLTLDDRVGDATLRQLLSHTSGPADNLTFEYRPRRLEPLARTVSDCADVPYIAKVGGTLERLAMNDSVPGPDAFEESALVGHAEQYRAVLNRLALPYAVDPQGRASVSKYAAARLTAADGLISTARDLAQFDLALKKGVLLRSRTLADAWTPPVGRNGQRLPHGLGWFVQSYNGEPVVWQFGEGENGSSALIMSLPRRELTLILLANSDGLAKPFTLAAGDVTVSPFGRLFLGIFSR